MNLWKDLETLDTNTNGANITTVRVLVEIPKGSELKYELDPEGKYMTIVRKMHPKYRYIYNYGMIPQTLGGDNDPLDAIILGDETFEVGSIINCKLVGAIKTIDQGEEDDKLLCIPYFSNLKKVNIKKIIKYLNNYKYPHQKGTKVLGLISGDEAFKLLEKAMKNFKENIK